MIKKKLTAQERYTQVVKVAMKLFSEKGFKGTTTREIAKKAGISEATIFKHFAKKDDLYSAIIDMQCNDQQGKSILMKSLEGRHGKEVFRDIAVFIIKGHQDDPTFIKLLMYSSLEGHNLSEMFMRTRGMELIDYLARYIERLMKEGSFRKMDAYLAARAFLGMVLHYSVSQEVYGMKKYFKMPLEKVTDTFVDIFYEGMVPAGSRKRRQT